MSCQNCPEICEVVCVHFSMHLVSLNLLLYSLMVFKRLLELVSCEKLRILAIVNVPEVKQNIENKNTCSIHSIIVCLHGYQYSTKFVKLAFNKLTPTQRVVFGHRHTPPLLD